MKFLQISELFCSIQGESTFAGLPCFFIRTAGCNLDCSYCDTRYAIDGGKPCSIESIIQKINSWPGRLVEITGGEPLLQSETYFLCKQLIKNNKQVLIETNGSLDIGALPPEAIKIMDVKCPDSGMSDRVYWPNFEQLRARDEVKFVLCSRHDYQWACQVIQERQLADKVKILFSAVNKRLSPTQLADWILEDDLTQVRLQLQMHKYLWPEKKRRI